MFPCKRNLGEPAHFRLDLSNLLRQPPIPTWVRPEGSYPCAGLSDWFNVAVLVDRSAGPFTLRLRASPHPSIASRCGSGFEVWNDLSPRAFRSRRSQGEEHMKRTLSVWLALMALAVAPVLAQVAPEKPMGKIHGKVTNPVGVAQGSGSVSLSNGPGDDKATFPVDANGEYTGEAPPGTYTLIFRQVDTPKDKQVDRFDNVKIVVGQTTEQDVDMSRPEFIKSLPADVQKQLEETKSKNSQALKANEVIKRLNADLKQVAADIHDADAAAVTAAQQLGASAKKAEIDAKSQEIKTQKFTDAESLMKQDSAAKPDASILWARLGQAQAGLKQYDDAVTSFKKALELESTSKKPSTEVQGLAQSGLGEAYARQGKVPEANEAFDAAAKLNPAQAGFYYKNQAVIFFQMGNATAQVAAADKAIGADPNNALNYYLKGQGLVGNATIDPKTQKIVLPPGCAEAYQKYLDLAPTGPYAADAKGILDQASQKINSTYKAGKKS
jgi:tetratricopeptide (TPR) repeat protein